MRGHSLIGWLRRLRANRSGAAALEFAIIAPIFFAIVFSTLEAGWLMTQTMMLDRAVDLTVRGLRIGNAGPVTHDAIRDRICDEVMLIGNCKTTLMVELIPITNLSVMPSNSSTCYNRGATVQPVVQFTPGQRSQVVFIRACVIVDPMTPFIGLGLALPKDASGGFRMVAYTAFANEP
jgi:Flp pilus assembly protein TadG